MAGFGGFVSQSGVSASARMRVSESAPARGMMMKQRWTGIVGAGLLAGTALSTVLFAQTSARAERGPYARIAVLRPHDGDTVDFEAGYIRHLEWHRQARDSWVWYGWSVTFAPRRRGVVYSPLRPSARRLDNPRPPPGAARRNASDSTPPPR